MTLTGKEQAGASWHDVPREIEVPTVSIPQTLRRSAYEWPDRVALDFMRSTVTYRELNELVHRAARGLLDLGVQAGDRVAIALPNCTSHVVAFYAVLRIGGVVVECNPTYSAAQLSHQLQDAGATVAIVWEKASVAALEARAASTLRTVIAVNVAKDLPLGARTAIKLPLRAARRTRDALRGEVPVEAVRWEHVTMAPPLEEEHPYPSPDDVALLQYTGGTTGVPKGAVLLHRNLLANTAMCEAWTRIRRGREVFYAALPFFHAFGLQTCMLLGIYTASTVVLFPKFETANVLAAQKRRPGTFFPAVAPMLERLARAAEKERVDLHSFSFAFAGAMPVPRETVELWEKATGGYAIEGYGMTETSPIALGNPVAPARRPGTLGLPFPSVTIRIVDAETLEDVPEGERGELLISGPNVFAGYWNQPEETAHQLLDGGWLRTGDIVVRAPDGWVTLVDRIKEMIVTGGFKVYPSQVEDRLRAMPGVADVAIVGMPADGDLGEKVVAAIVLDGTIPEINLAEVRAWASSHVAGYAVPRELHVVGELPRSIIGKVLRRVVREDLLEKITEAIEHPHLPTLPKPNLPNLTNLPKPSLPTLSKPSLPQVQLPTWAHLRGESDADETADEIPAGADAPFEEPAPALPDDAAATRAGASPEAVVEPGDER